MNCLQSSIRATHLVSKPADKQAVGWHALLRRSTHGRRPLHGARVEKMSLSTQKEQLSIADTRTMTHTAYAVEQGSWPAECSARLSGFLSLQTGWLPLSGHMSHTCIGPPLASFPPQGAPCGGYCIDNRCYQEYSRDANQISTSSQLRLSPSAGVCEIFTIGMAQRTPYTRLYPAPVVRAQSASLG